jgi:Putative  PD-(D/E)XK family member, (DUF4420)
MSLALDRIFDALSPTDFGAGHIGYSVARVSRYPGYFVGRDSNNKACILIALTDQSGRRHAPIRLENLDVEFEVRSRVTETTRSSEGTFTVIRCRSDDIEIVRYFFSIAETILRILGTDPSRVAITQAITHLARIFQRLLVSSQRSVTGLFGELFLMKCCNTPARALAGWRLQDSSRFDFTAGDLRLDVKTASGRMRVHTFSYDQCNPPAGTVALVASLFAEKTATGISIRELVAQIEVSVRYSAELIMKLHDLVAVTLGNSLYESLSVRFDEKLAASSLRFYDLRAIPAIRNELPPGVSDLHFRSDLTGSPEALIPLLVESEPAIDDFLPRL